MNTKEFNKLSMDDKAEYANENAWYIESIREGTNGFSLYKCENFFIEFAFANMADDTISIRALKNPKIIEKYIGGVELEKLF
jgi:hypothetical protein